MAGLVFAYFLCSNIAIKYLLIVNKLMLCVERLFCLNNQLQYVVLAQPKTQLQSNYEIPSKNASIDGVFYVLEKRCPFRPPV